MNSNVPAVCTEAISAIEGLMQAGLHKISHFIDASLERTTPE
jgi:hypothetical protein